MSLTLAEFVRKNKAMTAEEFLGRYPRPFLVVEIPVIEDSEEEGARHLFVTSSSHPVLEELANATSHERVVYYIEAKDGQPRSMVTVGRTRVCDICLSNPSVSKMHAYIQLDPTGEYYCVSDAGSTNGTTVNGESLVAKQPRPLEDGDRVVFAHHFGATYRSPASMHALICADQS